MTHFRSMSIWEPSINLMHNPSIYSTDWWMYPKDGTVLPRWTNNNLFLLEFFCCHGILSWKQSVYFVTKMLRRNPARNSGLEYVNVYVCKRVLFWCVFPKIWSNKGHSHELTNSFHDNFACCLSTRASLSTVLSMHLCVSSCLWANHWSVARYYHCKKFTKMICFDILIKKTFPTIKELRCILWYLVLISKVNLSLDCAWWHHVMEMLSSLLNYW